MTQNNEILILEASYNLQETGIDHLITKSYNSARNSRASLVKASKLEAIYYMIIFANFVTVVNKYNQQRWFLLLSGHPSHPLRLNKGPAFARHSLKEETIRGKGSAADSVPSHRIFTPAVATSTLF